MKLFVRFDDIYKSDMWTVFLILHVTYILILKFK